MGGVAIDITKHIQREGGKMVCDVLFSSFKYSSRRKMGICADEGRLKYILAAKSTNEWIC